MGWELLITVPDGVMEHSGNDLIGCNFDLTYRKGQFRFITRCRSITRKKITLRSNFSEYANANPYFEKRDADGKVNRYLEEYYTVNQQHYTIENPLYNASLNSFDRAKR